MKRMLFFLLALSPYVFAQTQVSGPVRIAVPGWAGIDSVSAAQGAPFSATITNKTIQTLTDGNRIVQTSTSTISRDSQGRTRQELLLPPIGKGSEAPRLVMIHDPVAHTAYTLNLTDETAHELRLPSSEVTSETDRNFHAEAFSVQVGPGELGDGPMLSVAAVGAKQANAASGNSQVRTEDLGSQTMEGLPVNGVRTIRTIPAGQIGNSEPITIVNEVWTSPDLKTVVYSKRVDPLTGEQTFQLSNIERAEPDPSLFSIPGDFKIVDGPRGKDHASE